MLRGRDAVADLQVAARVALTPYGEKDETVPLEVSEGMVKSAGGIDTLR